MPDFLRRCLGRALNSWPGYYLIRAMVGATRYRVFAPDTSGLMDFDLLRLRARLLAPPRRPPAHDRLHFGCGPCDVPGWVNADVVDSQVLVDLAAPTLPWPDGVFRTLVAHQVVEHLVLEYELLPLLRELRRVATPDAEIWLSCPDMEKVCSAYLNDRALGLIAERKRTATADLGMDGIPPQHYVNRIFRQSGQHKNLFDFELLAWALSRGGFESCERVDERTFLDRFPEFKGHDDEAHSLYVRARAGSADREKTC